MKSSDPSGSWAIQQIRLTDDAGNRINIEYDRAYDSTDLSVNLVNDGYTGDTDSVGTTVSNYAIVQTTDWEGKPAIAISGLASEQFEWLNIQLKHTASGITKHFHANEWQLNSDNTFETYAQSFQSNDPSGTWYVSQISVKDQAGNETRTEIRGASQESSPFKTTLTNPNYGGGSPADSTASDLTGPALSAISATVVDDGDGTYSVKISGTATDVGGNVNNLWLRFNNTEDAGAPSLNVTIDNNAINDATGAFEQTYSLDTLISGTYILKRLSLIHISETTRLRRISYAVLC